MAFPNLHFQDCYEITKKFERGANHCATSESVFALMTPILNNMRIMSQSLVNQIDATEFIKIGGLNTRNLENGEEPLSPQQNRKSRKRRRNSVDDEDDEDLGEALAEKMKECFPCEFRFDAAESYWTNMWEELGQHFMKIVKFYEQMLNQLLGMQDFFNLDNEVADLCSLQQFFTDSFCIPDLTRIIAALMALLAKLAIELSSAFGMIMNLIAPLLMPFLQSILNTLTQFAMLIVRPLQCAVDAMIAFLDKLDYSQLFQAPPANLSIGPRDQKKGGKSELVLKGSTFKPRTFETPDTTLLGIPQTQMAASPGGADTSIAQWERPDLSWGGSIDINPLHAVNRSEQAAVDEAEKRLKAIKADRGNYDLTDSQQRVAYNKKLNDARQEVDDTKSEQSRTEIQKMKESLVRFKGYIKGIFTSLLQYVREVIDVIETLVEDIGNEFKKLMESLTGANDVAMSRMFKKLEIMKLIELIAAMIELISGNRSCGEEPIDFTFLYPAKQGLLIWTDNDGSVHIEENGDDIQDALNAIVLAGGTNIDQGNSTPTDNGARQKLNSLIKLTGDETLDTTITKIVERVTTPSRVVFRCTLETSRAQATQVNKWLDELNAT